MLDAFLGALIFVSSVVSDGHTPAERLQSIQESQKQASQKYHTGMVEAKGEAERERVRGEFSAQVVANSDRALTLADRHPDDPSALEALIFVIRTARVGPSDRSKRAIERMQLRYVRDQRIGRICGEIIPFFHLPAAEKLMRSVLDQNPGHSARGFACEALARYRKNQGRMLRRLKADPAELPDYEASRGKARLETFLRENDPKTLEADAAGLFERCIAEYGAVKYDDRRTLAEVAQGELFDLRLLKVGDRAAEINGLDVDGKGFKLSDFRGKVVVLTFSGNWCAPCREMYPQERKLVETLKDEPFVLLSVNTDEETQTLRKALASGEMTWRCWCDGGTDGPITTRWGVQSFPTIFVLDPNGVIRFKNPRGERLDKAVRTLLDEMKTPSKSSP